MTARLKEKINSAFEANSLRCYEAIIGCGPETKTGADYIFRPVWWSGAGSLKVNPEKNRWVGNADGTGGDPFNLYAMRHGLNSRTDFPKVLKGVADLLGIANDAPDAAMTRFKESVGSHKPKAKRPPETVRAGSAAELARIKKADGFWMYHNAAGIVTAAVLREDKPAKDGGKPDKVIKPWQYDGAGVWTCEGFPKPRPLYNLHLLAQRPNDVVIKVEGEKAADAANGLLPDGFLAVCWSGGVGQVKYADFKPLYGRTVISIPDNDGHGKGQGAMRWVCSHLAGNGCDVSHFEHTDEFPKDGWDVADTFPAGWNIQRILDAVKPVVAAVVEAVEAGHHEHSQMFTDAWNADAFHERNNGRFLYHYDLKRWVMWDGKRWNAHADGYVMTAAKATARAIRERYSDGEDGKQNSNLKKLENAEKLNSMIGLSRDLLPAHAEDFDCNPWLLNCRNGILDLQTGQLSEHDPASRITKIINAEYDSQATSERWLSFMDDLTCGDEELARFLQAAVGYSLSGAMNEQKFFVLHGNGLNGKSVFLSVLRAILNGYAVESAPETFTRSARGDARTGPREDIVALDGSRLIYGGELEKGSSWSEGFIKRWTGGESISCRPNYGKQYELKPQGKLWFSVNDPPRSASADNGFWRRQMLIPCLHRVKRVDTHLDKKLLTESMGILSWAVEGFHAWQNDGLQIPAIVSEANRRVRSEQDTVSAFISECCETGGAELKENPTTLFEAYETFCKATGRKFMSQTAFGSSLEAKGFDKAKSAGKLYRAGICLISQNEVGHSRAGLHTTPLRGYARTGAGGEESCETMPYPTLPEKPTPEIPKLEPHQFCVRDGCGVALPDGPKIATASGWFCSVGCADAYDAARAVTA